MQNFPTGIGVSILLFWVPDALGSLWASLAYGGVVTNFGLALLDATSSEGDRSRAREVTAV